MFYDIYLDEVFYLREERSRMFDKKIDVFSGLEHYSKNEINNFKNGKITILKKENGINKFINISRNVFSNNEKLYYGKINSYVSQKINLVFPYNLTGFNLSLQTNQIKFIFKNFGYSKRKEMKEINYINDYDYYLIPSIIESFDDIVYLGINKFNNNTLKFTKNIDGIIYNLIVYISFKNHNLEIESFYKS